MTTSTLHLMFYLMFLVDPNIKFNKNLTQNSFITVWILFCLTIFHNTKMYNNELHSAG